MVGMGYQQRRQELTEYFDFTARRQWIALTSDSPVSKIRETVRAGRESMRRQLKDWLPGDLSGARVLDAGCGTGALAVDLARRGADVLAVDVAPNLVEHARERAADNEIRGKLTFVVGDMLDPLHGQFDYVVAMDSLIHYAINDVEAAICDLSGRTRQGLLVTVAPSTPALRLMHVSGRLFPRKDRAPDIQPISVEMLSRRLHAPMRPRGWRLLSTQRVANFFYTSHALRWVRP